MKVLHAMSGAPFGGTELHYERTAIAFAKAGVQQLCILRKDEARAKRLGDAGVAAVELPFKARFDFTSHRRYVAEIQRFAPDVLMTWTSDLSALTEKGAYVHVGRVSERFDATRYQTCDHLVAATQQRLDRAVAAGWPRARIHQVPNVIASDKRAGVPRRTFFTPDTAKLVVFVGRLTEGRGVEVLMDAVARISGVYLWVVGDGEMRQPLEERALEIGIKPRARFLGWRHDVPDLIAAADFVICPARQDDLGDTVLEAWAQGVPVIAADSLGPGLLIRHQDNGVLVPVDDARSMSEAIKWLIKDESFAARLAANGLATFVESHAEEHVVKQYLDLCEAIVKDAAAPPAASS